MLSKRQTQHEDAASDVEPRSVAPEKVNILLVDDQPAKLLSYETILESLGENLIKADSAREALKQLLKHDVAVILIDVCMPDLDGFELAAMIREHPRFKDTAIIFVSAIHLADVDRLRAYEMGAVDYVPVPVVPEVLRAKVRIFAELRRKTRELEQLNRDLEQRVSERTAELEASTERLRRSEERRSLALMAGEMGSWEFDPITGQFTWDDGQYRIFGVEPDAFQPSLETIKPLIHPDDWSNVRRAIQAPTGAAPGIHTEFRVRRPNGALRWCVGTAVGTSESDYGFRSNGVTVDITERKLAEERQSLLAREVDHRARNVLALVQSIVRLTRANDVNSYVSAVDGRIGALSRAHTLLSESRWRGADLAEIVEAELAPYNSIGKERVSISGSRLSLDPKTAQTLALALHELATNAAKYGALSVASGRVIASWTVEAHSLMIKWLEKGGPDTRTPTSSGFGVRMILASIEKQLQGKVDFSWTCDGLACTLTVPLTETDNTHVHPARRLNVVGEKTASVPKLKSGSRVLVVEDEVLVAMLMEQALLESKITVVGPFNDFSTAMIAAVREPLDAGIVDINLGGESIYPIAEVLIARDIPFVFVTGYGAESVHERFAHVPVIKKPIQRQAFEMLFR